MGNFRSLQHRRRTTSSLLSQLPPTRPFAPPSPSHAPSPLSDNQVTNLEHTRHIGWSLERIAIQHPDTETVMQRQTPGGTISRLASTEGEDKLPEAPHKSSPQKENTTGLPDHLKAGIESLSGLSLDDVHVHYGSSQPAKVQALAYTQGTEIHVGPGQEKHLGHEVWHVVQQKQGRVRPTFQLQGVAINNDSALEREADIMGERARSSSHDVLQQTSSSVIQQQTAVVQRVHEALVEHGDVHVTAGRAGTSWSLAGGSKKPLAIIEGTLNIAGIDRDIEVHVHLNANDPVSTFSGANIRYRGDVAGFAYWPGDIVNTIVWLKNILDSGLPNWDKKATWVAADTENKIIWSGPVAPGWRFDEADRIRRRRDNKNYQVTFEINFNKERDSGLFGDELDNAIPSLLKPQVVGVKIAKGNKNRANKITLSYENEQMAYERLADDTRRLEQKWSTSANFQHTPSVPWV